MDLGDKLKYLRNRKWMSLQELTDDLNKYYINENGKNLFTFEKTGISTTGCLSFSSSKPVK